MSSTSERTWKLRHWKVPSQPKPLCSQEFEALPQWYLLLQIMLGSSGISRIVSRRLPDAAGDVLSSL